MLNKQLNYLITTFTPLLLILSSVNAQYDSDSYFINFDNLDFRYPVSETPLEVSLRAEYNKGIKTLQLVIYPSHDFTETAVTPLRIINTNCKGKRECEMSFFLDAQEETGYILNTNLFSIEESTNSFGKYIGSKTERIEFICNGCLVDTQNEDFIRWMRISGYEECLTSMYLDWLISPHFNNRFQEYFNSKDEMSNILDISLFDMVANDDGSTSTTLRDSPNCQLTSNQPEFCPIPVPSDYSFLEEKLSLTFRRPVNIDYSILEINYIDELGLPELIENGQNDYYRFSSRNNFLDNFEERSIIHWAIESLNGLPIQDMTGASTGRVEISLEPFNILGIGTYSHEIGHTFGSQGKTLPHNFIVLPDNTKEFFTTDGIMDNSYRPNIDNLYDPLNPLESYIFEPPNGYSDSEFVNNYNRKIIGSYQLPDCSTVDPAIEIIDTIQEGDILRIIFRIYNNGDVPTGYIPLKVYNGDSLIHSETIRYLSSRDITKTIEINNDNLEYLKFEIDSEKTIKESNELNNLAYYPSRKVFIRGDSNMDGRVDLSDPIYSLNSLFLGGESFQCDDSADANDDGLLDLSDPINTLNYLFLGAEILPVPFPDPGIDYTDDQLNC